MTGFLAALLAGLLTGILSGFGVGGGTLLLLWMTAVGVEQHTAQGINLLYFLPAAALALPAHRKNGYLEPDACRWAIPGGLCAAAALAVFSAGLDTAILHRCFGVFLVIVGLRELFSRD